MRLRPLLLATVAVITLAAGPPAAEALLGPGQIVFDPTAVAQLLQSVGIEGQQLTQMIATVNEIIQVYNETVQILGVATNIWGDVENIVGADQWAPGLQCASCRNPLEFPAAQHPAWVGGFMDPAGLQFGSTYVTQNTVGGTPTIYDDATFAGTELKKAVWALSSIQAVSSNHLQSIENRIAAIGDLFQQLGQLGKLVDQASLTSRLHTELNYAHSQHIQATQLASAAQTQWHVFELNQRQFSYQDETAATTAICADLATLGADAVPASCQTAPPTAATVAATH